ncbi:MAG: hypothetical protein QM778_22745 [Myxococcales bacterium]
MALAVGAPVMVAALVNRNDFVKVFDTARCSRAWITAMASFPLASAATATGATRSTATAAASPRRLTSQV